MPLKGTVISQRYIEDPLSRGMRDVDLLIASSDHERTSGVLLSLGYRPSSQARTTSVWLRGTPNQESWSPDHLRPVDLHTKAEKDTAHLGRRGPPDVAAQRPTDSSRRPGRARASACCRVHPHCSACVAGTRHGESVTLPPPGLRGYRRVSRRARLDRTTRNRRRWRGLSLESVSISSAGLSARRAMATCFGPGIAWATRSHLEPLRRWTTPLPLRFPLRVTPTTWLLCFSRKGRFACSEWPEFHGRWSSGSEGRTAPDGDSGGPPGALFVGCLRCCDGYSTVTGFPQNDPIESSTSSPNLWSQLPSGVAGATTPTSRIPTSPMTDTHPRILSICFGALRRALQSTSAQRQLDSSGTGSRPPARRISAGKPTGWGRTQQRAAGRPRPGPVEPQHALAGSHGLLMALLSELQPPWAITGVCIPPPTR